MENNAYKKNTKIIDTVSYNGKYIDVCTFRNRIISAAIALAALASFGLILWF